MHSLHELGLLTLAFAAVTGLAVVLLLWRYLGIGRTMPALAGLIVWLSYATAMGYFGLVADSHLPVPGILLLVLPIFALGIFGVARGNLGANLGLSAPLSILVGFQVFRVGVELVLLQLYHLGKIPRIMMLAGGNLDILVGLSAPFVALASTNAKWGKQIALAWSFVGIASLINIAARSVLSAPGPLHLLNTDVPNLAMGTFPFTFVPGFFAPLALMLHMVVIRSTLFQMRLNRTVFERPADASSKASA